MAEEPEFDVFLSYAREDKAVVAPLVERLLARGFTVWWDQEMPAGVEFQNFIPSVIRRSKSVLVVWTTSSTESIWVRSEANRAASQKKMLALIVDNVEVPPPYDAFNNIFIAERDLREDPDAVLRRLDTGFGLLIRRSPLDPKATIPREPALGPPRIEPLPSGAMVGNYMVIRTLGRGGFWYVYQAWDMKTAKKVTLREGAPSFEGRRLKPLDDPSITDVSPRMVRYYEGRTQLASVVRRATDDARLGGADAVFSANQTWYAIHSASDGMSLDSALTGTTLNGATIVALVERLAPLLQKLHALEYVHGDIKPGNILITGDAAALKSADTRQRNWDVSLIDFDTWTPFGERITAFTPSFAAPESVGGVANVTSDIYSLGAMLFYVWTGRAPADEGATRIGGAPTSFYGAQQVLETLKPLAKSAVERRLALAIAASTAVDPKLRPASIASLLEVVLQNRTEGVELFKRSMSAGSNVRKTMPPPRAPAPAFDPGAATMVNPDATIVYRGSEPTIRVADWKPTPS